MQYNIYTYIYIYIYILLHPLILEGSKWNGRLNNMMYHTFHLITQIAGEVES